MKDDQPNKKCCLPEDHVTIDEEDTKETEKTTLEPDNSDGKNGNGSNGNGDGDDKDGSVFFLLPKWYHCISVFCEDKRNPKTGKPDCPKLVKYCDHPVYGFTIYHLVTYGILEILRPDDRSVR